MAENMITPNAPAFVCDRDECGWEVAAPLMAVALRCHCSEGSAEDFLCAAHCCACVQAGCPCGGYLTMDDLQALITAFAEANPEDDGPFEWDAAWAFEMIHADHRTDQDCLVCVMR